MKTNENKMMRVSAGRHHTGLTRQAKKNPPVGTGGFIDGTTMAE